MDKYQSKYNDLDKKNLFMCWFELLSLLEYASIIKNDFSKLYDDHLKMFDHYAKNHYFRENITILEVNVFRDTNVYNEIVHKFLDTIIRAYYYVQSERARGGTAGIKANAIYTSLKDSFEVNKALIEKAKNEFI
ncbi:MAG: hypothetical protein ACK4FS_10250 [Flavobacterium sp.]